MVTKQEAELDFWRRERYQYARWFRGSFRSGEMYGIPSPTPAQKITRYETEFLNALETWVNADRMRYCRHLLIPPTYWGGRRILEIGCGPLGLGRFFVGADLMGLDPLMLEYEKLGYPINNGMSYHVGGIENTTISDNSAHAVFSVNAIDHVDSFAEAIDSIEKVCRDDGEIRIEVHYHAPTTTEPFSLNDDIVRSAFKVFDMKKISELPSTAFYPPGTHPTTDRFALWSNRSYVWEGALNLR